MLLRLLIKPRWLLRHVIVIGMCVGFFFLSRWQFHRGELTTGTVQNYGYSVEWLAFGGCVCFGWWKMLQDELHPEGRKVARAARAGAAAASHTGASHTSPWRSPVAADVATLNAADAAAQADTLGRATVVAEAEGILAGAVPGSTADETLEPARQVLHSPDGQVPAALLAGRRPEQELTTAEIDPDDEEVIAYNAWLAEMAAKGPRGYRRMAR